VTIAFAGDRLRLTIENTVLKGNGYEPGAGIVGMRERAAALGGSLEAGMVAGRFRVAAELPFASAA
jgi:signal transduction histidine kinase